MNNLSWLIYLIQLLDGLHGIICGALMITIVFFIGRCAIFAISEGDSCAKDWPLWTKRCAITVFVCCVLHVAVPTKQTVLLIAGSQVGEMIVKSDAVQGVVNPGMNLLKTWINEETESLLPKAPANK